MDTHRNLGYDLFELLLAPAFPPIEAKIAGRLLQKWAGPRMLTDVVSLDASLRLGSHGRRAARQKGWPLFIGSRCDLIERPVLSAIKVLICSASM